MSRAPRRRPPPRDGPAPLFAELLRETTYRWLSITPQGFELAQGRIESTLHVRLLHYGAARTLYRKRKPACRSLDAVRSHLPPARECESCPERRDCTPQICLELLIEVRLYRLLLAYTSARNFIEHLALLDTQSVDWNTTSHVLRAVPRGSWGEVRFELPQPLE